VTKAETKGPRFVRYFGPVVEVLKDLGGSGRPDEVRAMVASRLAISEQEQGEQIPSGSSRFDNQVAWARFYLTRAGLLDSSRRGIWSLTEKGRATTLSHAAALQIMKDLHKAFAGSETPGQSRPIPRSRWRSLRRKQRLLARPPRITARASL
jgi:restriction system protein